jgi:hypothetical protein
MVSIKQIDKEGKTLLVIDYSNCKEAEMLSGEAELKERILQINKPILLISVFNDQAYVTPTFMRTAERDNVELSHLLEKQAVVGLNPIKKMILKGFNLLMRRNVRNFESVEEAMEFLLDSTTTDRDFKD